MTRSNDAPAPLGYRWPAEWEPHAATWLAWPHNQASWPGHFEPVPEEFAAFVRALARFEPVHIEAGGPDILRQAWELVGDVAHVILHDIPTNDAWCRDHGPTFLAGPPSLPPAAIAWEYNAWGGKYPPFDLDNLAAERIAALAGRRLFQPGVVLEGGAIEGNGQGTILTTASCLLNPNRNGATTREQMEALLRDYLGARQVLWLTGGEVEGDDTDGHIDQLARFVGPRTIVAAVCEDPADPNYGPTQQNLAELQSFADPEGRPFEIVRLPLPAPIQCDGQRLPASYCNFYIANGVVCVPQFGDPADAIAMQTLAELLPGRQAVGLPSRHLSWGLGSFHCLSQQEPMPHAGCE